MGVQLGQAELAERMQRAEKLALEILALSRHTLTVRLRFLDRALSRLTPRRHDRIPFGTDGQSLWFEPLYVIRRWREEPEAVTRDTLHVLLHCVFRHGFVSPETDRVLWDLACDIAVESLIGELAGGAFTAGRASRQAATLDVLRSEVGALTAERLYRWFTDHSMDEMEAQKLREAFLGDSHAAWRGSGEGAPVEVEADWEDISRKMETELAFLDEDGALSQSLRALNRTRASYTELLRRFGVWGEQMHLNDEEFDQNYYTYGLSLYGNVPLIEPLEYRERRGIRDFVVAIDTSGSVSGAAVQSFVEHTCSILMEGESFFNKVNIHILQCDDRVREDVLITCREDLQEYMDRMEILGLGETDFRPVFAHVAELLRRRELRDLRGLLYFTDGRGVFPREKPPYDTAFILRQDGYEPPRLPPWAISLTMAEEDILDRRFDRAYET